MSKPLKYPTVEALEAAIEAYFAACEPKPALDAYGDVILDKHQRPVILPGRPATMAGLALALGLSRMGLLRYAKRGAYGDAVLRARARVEVFTEEQLFTREGVFGAKFSLANNFGWKEKADSGSGEWGKGSGSGAGGGVVVLPAVDAPQEPPGGEGIEPLQPGNGAG